MSEVKRCTRCGEVKPLGEFPPRKGARDGRDSRCRVCNAKRVREAYWKKQGIPPEDWPRLHTRHAQNENMRQLNAIFGGKWCPDCEQHLPREDFHRASSSADGLNWYCKACESARKAAYFRTDAGRASSKGRDHRRRARLRELPTDGSGPRDWLRHHEETDTWYCHLCGGGFERGDEITWDHRDPVTGGTTGTVVANMAAAHAACNYARSNTPLEEWHARVGVPDGVV